MADGCDDEVDNAVGALTSLLEPIMIVFLAVVVGSIVIAMFMPILAIINGDSLSGPTTATAILTLLTGSVPWRLDHAAQTCDAAAAFESCVGPQNHAHC